MHLQGLIGIFLLLGMAFILSNNRKQINYRIVGWGLSLQFLFGVFILKTPFGKPLFGFFDKVITRLISFSDAGSDFLFKSLIPGVGYHEAMVNFAFRALPTIIFFFQSYDRIISLWCHPVHYKMDRSNNAKNHGDQRVRDPECCS